MAIMENGASVSISSKVIETVISAQTKFKGSVHTDKPIRIDGYFEGEIVSTDVVEVSKGGEFKGIIKCNCFNLYGNASGSAECKDLLHIAEGASYSGDVVTSALETVRGSKLNGKVQIIG